MVSGADIRPLLAPPQLRRDDADSLHFPDTAISTNSNLALAPASPGWVALLDPRNEIPQISVKASAFSLISTMVGGGSLSIPFAFQESGVILGSVILVVLACCAIHSLELLVSCSRRCEKREPSYSDVAFEALGPMGRNFCSLLIFLLVFFATVAYIILEGDILPYLFSLVTGAPLESVWYTQRHRIFILVGICVFPIVTVRRLSALRFTSFVSLMSVTFLAICMTIRAFTMPQTGNDGVKMVRGGMRVFLSISVMSVSFLCHFNMLPVHFELKRPTRRRVSRLVHTSITVATGAYLILGLSGYYTFSGHVMDNILNNYSEKDMLISCGRFGLSITLMCGIALISLPARVLVDDTLFPGRPYSRFRSCVEAACILTAAVLVAIQVPRIVDVWGFVGSTLASLAMFVLPPIFYLRLRPRPLFHDRKATSALVLLVFGVVICILCTVDSCLNVINGAPRN